MRAYWRTLMATVCSMQNVHMVCYYALFAMLLFVLEAIYTHNVEAAGAAFARQFFISYAIGVPISAWINRKLERARAAWDLHQRLDSAA